MIAIGSANLHIIKYIYCRPKYGSYDTSSKMILTKLLNEQVDLAARFSD